MPQHASVAVVIPAKDRAAVLGDALRSVRAQTVVPEEVFVVDDGSSDDTADIARSFGATVLVHPSPQGSGAARNTAIRAATTRWIAFLDSDDVWLPEHLEYVCDHADGHAIVSAAGVDTNGRGWGNVSGRSIQLTPERCFVPETPIVTSAALADRRLLLQAGLFRRFPRAQDADMWARLLEIGTGVALPRPTAIYRVPQGLRDRGAIARDFSGLDQVVEALSDRPWMTRSVRSGVRCRLRWDEMRRSMAERELLAAARAAGWIGAHPTTWPGLLQLLDNRRRSRDDRWRRVLEAAPNRIAAG